MGTAKAGAPPAARRARRVVAGALAVVLAAGASAVASVEIQGGLRIDVLAQISPVKLPRTGTAPISIFVAGHLQSADGGIPSQLQKLRIEVNRHGLLQSRGLAVCPFTAIQPASSQRAVQACRSSLIGAGQFWANIVLPGQPPYPTQGRLLVFNGREGGRPVIYAHIFTENPFPTSFVVAFSIRHISKGQYGTRLEASLPDALGEWGYLDRIKLTLSHKYTYRGRQLSYFNAGCPAPPGTRNTSFPLARATFSFAHHAPLSTTVEKSCTVRGP